MPTATMAESVTDQLKHRARARVSEFWRLAGKMARGAKSPLKEVEETLAEAGKTPDDLSGAVQSITDRMKLHADMLTLPTVQAEFEAVKIKRVGANQKLAAATSEWERVAPKLSLEESRINARIYGLQACRSRLVDTCPYSELNEQLKAIDQRIRLAGMEITKVYRAIGLNERDPDVHREWFRMGNFVLNKVFPGGVEAYAKPVRLRRAQEYLVNRRRELAEAQAERVSLEEKMLEP